MSIDKAQIQALRDNFIQSLGGSFDKYKDGDLHGDDDVNEIIPQVCPEARTKFLEDGRFLLSWKLPSEAKKGFGGRGSVC